jgi:formylglycine-generating enzyme required for sulfatase activity/serine/threonine protein kinase/Tol biopolymer transport system component
MTDETIFAAALEQPSPADRSAYLDSACAGDPERRKRIEGLLAAHDRATSFLERPAVAAADPGSGPTRAYDTPTGPAEDGTTLTHGEGGEDPADDTLSFLAPAGRADSLGRIGHYEVLEVLGKGGFGIVFRAFDDVLQRVVAVKVLAPQLATTSPARKRFLREARSAAQVRHENVVHIHAIEEQPLPYLVMEFIPGETLQQRLDRTGPLEVPEVLRIGRQIAEGLAAAHEQGLIHRDIKPSNILLDFGPQQHTKITDFGLARAADDASLTRSGVVAGTPMYMAPEQARGETLDHRADLFSLGSVLYAMLTGRPPFRAENTPAVLKRVTDDTPRPIREVIPEVPKWLCRIVEKLQAKDPADRFQSAREVADLLADCEQQLKAHGALKDYSSIPGGGPRRRARQIAEWVAAAALIAVIGVSLAWWRGWVNEFFAPHQRAESAARPADPVNEPAPAAADPKALPADPIAQFTAGDKPPAKTLFPGRLITWMMFDDPMMAKGSPSQNTPSWQRKIDNGLSVTTFDIKGGGNPPPVWFSVPTGDYALITRFRCENTSLDLRLREWQEGDALKTLMFRLGFDGNWWVFRLSYRRDGKGGWYSEPGGILARSAGPLPELANGTWINLAARLSGRTTEVWANGRQIARFTDPGPGPGAVEARQATGFDGRPGISGPGRYEIAHIAVWELVPSSVAPPEPPPPADPRVALKKWNGVRIGEGAKASWSGDGQRVAFFRNHPHRIDAYDLTTRTTTTLLDRGNDPAGVADPAVAPDEPGRVAFVISDGKGGSEVWLAEDGVRRKVADGGYPSWMPDGRTLLWRGVEPEGPRRPRLMRMDVEAETPRPQVLATLAPDASLYPCVTPDGRTVAYASQGQITVLDLQTSTIRMLPFPNGRAPKGFLGGWHPNGRYLGFGSYGVGENFGLWVMDTATGESRQLLAGDATHPVWSPDGTRLAIDIRGASGTNEVWLLDAPSWHDLPVPPAVAPFDEKKAKDYQESLAKRLGVPVEFENSVGMKMRLIPPGTYRMDPNFWVTLSRPLRVAAHEVTVAQFRAFVEATGYKTTAETHGNGLATFIGASQAMAKKGPEFTWRHKDLARGDDYPVGQVSWADAVEFCKWLSRKEGRTYRLPTEAEWEWACRAGSMANFHFGDDPEKLPDYAWFAGNSDDHPHPVGTKLPNAWGLFDMHGNVAEHCSDWAGTRGWGAATDPVGPPTGQYRVIRSTCFAHPAEDLRSSFGGAYAPTGSMNHFGFRVVCEQVSTLPAVVPFPFDDKKAKDYQEAWAKHLGTKVEFKNKIGMDLRVIPPGDFLMGTKEADLKDTIERARQNRPPGWQFLVRSLKSESPQHPARITRPFAMGKYEVTVEQFQKFVEDTGYKTTVEQAGGYGVEDGKVVWGKNYNWKNVGFERPDLSVAPVWNVSRDDAVEFCKWLSKREGKTYRLPTEAEWEWACRAGTATRTFWNGERPADALPYAWGGAKSGHQPQPVGKRKPNPFGLYDTCGNVWEWCDDWYSETYYKDSPAADPPGPPVPEGAKAARHRVQRGGGVDGGRFAMNSTGRSLHEQEVVGFRVVCEFAGDAKLPPPEVKKPPANPALTERRKEVAERIRILDTARLQFDVGRTSKLPVLAAEAELTEAWITLANEERNPDAAAELLGELVAQWQEANKVTAELVKAGLEPPGALNAANSRLADAKDRLAKAKPAAKLTPDAAPPGEGVAPAPRPKP